jgi:LuxR family transcriptional regulator, maltose regulon positive regulatory protein
VTTQREPTIPHLRPVGPGPSVLPQLAVIEGKLQPPPARPGMIPRTAIVDRLRASGSARIVLIRAPAGYGKTSLLAQWAEADDRPVAWISLDRHDDDPIVVLTHLAAAIDRIEPIGPDIVRTLGGPVASIRTRILPELALALRALPRPILLILDDVHELEHPEALSSVILLAGHLPEGSQLAIAARGEPKVPIARYRARGALLELGPADLALDVKEAYQLFAGTGLELPMTEVSDLTRRTEGWAAGLYLAALAIQSGGPASAPGSPFSDNDRYVEDYLRTELTPNLSQRELRFLSRTSVLDRLTASLCDAVVGRSGSTTMLGAIEQANLFLVPLDHEREWYRYHPLFRAMLQAELQRREPGIRSELLTRAAAWCEANEMFEQALAYAFEAGDLDHAAALFERLAQPVFQSGRMATVRRWLDRFDAPSLARNPSSAALAALGFAFVGEASEADHRVDEAVRATLDQADGAAIGASGTSSASLVALARAMTAPNGVDQMIYDATIAVDIEADWSPWRPFALLLAGVGQVLIGNVVPAQELLLQAAAAAERLGGHPARSVALAELAALAIDRRDWSTAEAHARSARSVVVSAGLDDYPVTSLAYAVTARTMAHRGDLVRARTDLAHLARIVPSLTYGIPWLAIQTRSEMARVHLGLGETDAARDLVKAMDAILDRRPDVGVLRQKVDGLRRQVASSAVGTRVESLTEAELRLVPLLPTHLSFIEIAEIHVLSPNTVKTQAISIYRKLGASSRSDAVARARELGLLEH